ncbi:MAG: NAD(P)H-dependent oxidoreductase subunit E [Saprospiraceae bacterium]
MTNSHRTAAADRAKTLDHLWSIQQANGFIADGFVKECAAELGISQIELEGIISFYHFFHRQPTGEFVIYLNNSIVSECQGFQRVKEAFERETGNTFGKPDPSGKFALLETACIGLSDQEPAALINFHPFTNLNTLKVKRIIAELKKGTPVESISDEVLDHIRFVPEGDKGILLRDYQPGLAVWKLPNLGREGVIEELKKSKLRGMGGAYFPTGLKWEFCKKQPATPKYIVCNADEGEPGTFKDRVLLNKLPGLLLEGMIAAAYAVGAGEGIVYLRAEYRWLLNRLENTITDFRKRGLLGKNVAGIAGFDFDIRIQLGAGAYVCGEETALLNSMEGKRGEPRAKVFFPTEKGFLDKPTVINNVETFCAAARIIGLGADHYLKTGTPQSPGTKLLSISGDCHRPGIYEVEWGTKVADILEMCGADDAYYVQVSGPSGECVSAKEFGRSIALDDLQCGGSFMIFNSKRDVLNILRNFTDFFKQESCGVCTPCRAGNFIIQRKLDKIANGLAYSSDYKEVKQWGNVMAMTSRCGLGKMATRSLLMALDKFPDYFASKVDPLGEGLNKKFDMEKALQPYEQFGD